MDNPFIASSTTALPIDFDGNFTVQSGTIAITEPTDDHWVSADGRITLIDELTEAHLKNILNKIKRDAKTKRKSLVTAARNLVNMYDSEELEAIAHDLENLSMDDFLSMTIVGYDKLKTRAEKLWIDH